ncbi:MAG TPA: hypothetical protein PLM22_08115 [Candidatus Sabulitectum sp.]|nr:hypothetical protein [Candidatus Sabulitectum sp.]HPR22578.1 hypothetical protein [Candidatus Sabulitectum sp.]
MAVRGLDLLSERFTGFRNAFVLIGGAACDLWFSDQNLSFRTTRDLDIVLILDRLTPGFVERFRDFIQEGAYSVKQRNEDCPPVLYRFAKPGKEEYPYMIELFCRAAPGLDLDPGQQIIPVRMEGARSLSAILLHESYYKFLLDHCRESRGIFAADAAALIPLKARAWLDLTERKAAGEHVKEDDIKKHRNDVFRLAITLPGEPDIPLPNELAHDVESFLSSFPPENEEWEAINQAIRPIARGPVTSKTLLETIRIYFQLADKHPEGLKEESAGSP